MLRFPIEILPGELADRLSILQLRIAHLPQVPTELAEERASLRQQWDSCALASSAEPLVEELSAINAQLWDIEDQLRLHEQQGDFGPAFVEQARSVYRLNDRRSLLKRQINLTLCGSPGEPKVHPAGSTADMSATVAATSISERET